MANAQQLQQIRNCSWKDDAVLKDALSIYVQQNLSRPEILDFITHEFPQYAWSERTLDRRRKHFGIYYIDKAVTVEQVQNAVKEELKGPGELLGYRAMHQKLRQEHHLCVPRAVVHAAMYEADPGALERRKPCLKKKKQKIERWWKDLHERLEKHYKKQLVSLKDTGQYDPENQLHRNLLAFVIVPLIQREADIFVSMWNSHRIRAQKNTLLPDGVPNHIHAFPERYGLEECGRPISTEDLEAAAVASAFFDDNPNYIPTEVEDRCIELIRQSNQDLSNVSEKFMYLKYAY